MCCFCTGTLRSTFDSPNRFSLMLWIDKRGFRYIANRTNLKSTRNKNYAFGCTSLNYNGIHQKWLLFRCLKDIYTLCWIESLCVGFKWRLYSIWMNSQFFFVCFCFITAFEESLNDFYTMTTLPYPVETWHRYEFIA